MTHEFVRRPNRNAGDRDDFSSPQKKSQSNKNFHARPSSNDRDAALDRTQEVYSDGKFDGDAWVRSLEVPSAPTEENKPANVPAPEEEVREKAPQDAELFVAKTETAPELLAKTADRETAEDAVAPIVEEAPPESDRPTTHGSKSESEDGTVAPTPDIAEGMGDARNEFAVLKQEALLAELENKQSHNKAQALLGSLEIEQAIGDPRLLERMQATLQQANEHGPKAAFVYIHLLPDGVETILLPPSGSPILEVVRVNEMVDKKLGSGAEAVLKEAWRMMEAIDEAFATLGQILPHAQFLYEQTIAPLEKHLKRHGIEHIQLVVDGRLQHISMAGLHDETGYLIERFSIAYSHSFQQTEIETTQRDYGNAEISALGESDFSKNPAPDLIDLEYAKQEIEAVNALDGNAPTNTTLTKENIQGTIDALERGREILGEEQLDRLLLENGHPQGVRESILHLSTHAEGTHLYTAESKLTIDEFGSIDFKGIELLILSACNTAVGGRDHPNYGLPKSYIPEQAYGLSGEAVRAGAKSALGSQFYVSDELTKQFAMLLHHQLRERGLGAAEALQHAQVAMLKGEVKEDGNLYYTIRDEEFSIPIQQLEGVDPSLFNITHHPRFWAAFQIVGDWE